MHRQHNVPREIRIKPTKKQPNDFGGAKKYLQPLDPTLVGPYVTTPEVSSF